MFFINNSIFILLKLKNTESEIKGKSTYLLTLVWEFKKIGNEHKLKYENFCSSSKAEVIIN